MNVSRVLMSTWTCKSEMCRCMGCDPKNLVMLPSSLKSHFVKVGTASFDGTTRRAEDGSLRSPCSSVCVVFV